MIHRFVRIMITTALVEFVVLHVPLSAGADSIRPIVAVLTPGATYEPLLDGLREGLARRGYLNGQNFRLVVEDTRGDIEGLRFRAMKVVDTKPDVLVTLTTAVTAVAKQANQQIPIVFTLVANPVHYDLVHDFASSRNNMTGVSTYAASLAGKRLEVLTEIVSKVKAVLAIVSSKEKMAQDTAEFLDNAAKKMGIQIVRRDVATVGEFENVLRDKSAMMVDAVFYVPSNLLSRQIRSLIMKLNRVKIPFAVNDESMVKMGALTSYGGDYRLFGLQAAKLVAKILKGAKPSDLPIEAPDRFLLTINLKTAKAIGLDISRKVLERADRLLE